MAASIITTVTKEETTSDTVDPNDLNNLTDEELLSTLQKLEQEKEQLAQQQLLREIERLQEELKLHEKQKSDRQRAPDSTAYPGHGTNHLNGGHSTDIHDKHRDIIDELPIEELSERLEELKKQREDLSNKKLLEEIEALQNDIRKLQTDTDHKETRMIAEGAVAVYALSPSEIEIRWDTSDFGHVASYVVFHKPATADDSKYQSIPLDGHSSSCLIQKLNGNTKYHIKMEAEGLDKSEIKTDVVEVTTFRSVRGFVLILANSKGFQLKALSDLEQTAKDAADLKSAFEKINFEVQLEENLTGSQMIESIQKHREKLDQSGVDCLILVLASYKYHGYIFGIDGGVLINKLIDCLKFNPDTDTDGAHNKQRLVFIDTVKIKEETIEELDDSYQPRNVRVRYMDPTKVEISFRPPKLSENQVVKFVVALADKEKTTSMKSIEALHTKDYYACEFAKLRVDTEYRFEVFATYVSLNGQSVHGLVKTYNKDSNRPKLFGVELISQSQIYAFWKPATAENHDNIMYKVYLREDSGNADVHETTVSYPCHIFDNLKQNTIYQIKVSIVRRENNNLEDSDLAEITISTPKDGTPIIMGDSTTAYILGNPNFLIATASGAFVSSESPSFLRCFTQHLEKKYNRYDIASIIQDVRNELVYTSERYDMPVLSSTLNNVLFLGGPK